MCCLGRCESDRLMTNIAFATDADDEVCDDVDVDDDADDGDDDDADDAGSDAGLGLV